MSPTANSDTIAGSGIAIRFEPAGHLHIGILHRAPDSPEIKMLNLAWHHQLRNEKPEENYLWLKPGINPRRLKQLAAKCRLVWKRHRIGGVPFGFSPPSSFFDKKTGQFLIGFTKHGLTCATFVLAVFDLVGLKLVNYGSWPLGRPGDSDWQKDIVDKLSKTGAEQSHIDAVRGEIGIARFRPEEVAGAALESRIPVDFKVAERRGGEVLDRLNSN